MLKYFEINKSFICSSLFRYNVKQKDPMLQCVCSVRYHRRRQNVVRTSTWNLFVNSILSEKLLHSAFSRSTGWQQASISFASRMVESWTTAADEFRRSMSKSHIKDPVDYSQCQKINELQKTIDWSGKLVSIKIIPKRKQDKCCWKLYSLLRKLKLKTARRYSQ